MGSIRYAYAMREVLEYLKGIRKEDLDKIPYNVLKYLEENASREYECNIDYEKPLKELNLMNESKGIIGWICYKYWCDTEEKKREFLNKLNENEKKFEETLKENYDVDNIFFKNRKRDYSKKIQFKENDLIIKKESKIKRLCNKLFNIIKR